MILRSVFFTGLTLLGLITQPLAAKSGDGCKILRNVKDMVQQDLIVDNTTLSLVRQDLQIDKEILSILETECVTYILELPYEISAPGYYKLACDLVFDPSDDGENAITVTEGVNDVTIDFAFHTVSMAEESTANDNNGILLSSGCQNVRIMDGTITGFSASQIRGYDSLNTVDVRNMFLIGTTSRMINETISSGINLGAVLEDPQAFEPQQEAISNNIVLKDVTIRSINLENQDIADQYAWGVALFYCNNIELENVLVSDITHTGLVDYNAAGYVVGFGMNFCSNSISRFCTGRDLSNLSPDFEDEVVGDAVGGIYTFCNHVANYDCTYSRNLGTRRGGGLVWFAGTTDFIAERCVADSNHIVDETAPAAQSHYGFETVGIIARNQRGAIIDCHVFNQPTAFAALLSDDIIYENCTAIAGNIQASPTILPAGFRAYSTANGVTYKNCVATGFLLPTPSTESGFRFTSGAQNINILNCKSTKNGNGIYVANGVTRVVADSNELEYNTVSGLQDATPSQTHNLYVRNVAFANGTNYIVNTANPNFKVVQANQAAGYPLYTAATASPLSNFDLQP